MAKVVNGVVNLNRFVITSLFVHESLVVDSPSFRILFKKLAYSGYFIARRLPAKTLMT